MSWLLIVVLQVAPPLVLVGPQAPAAAPLVITLADALERAKQNDATFQPPLPPAIAHKPRRRCCRP